jgi:dihydroxyacetone kinase-like predicted kinase
MQMGTSIQLGEGDGLYRLHIHVPTEKRYEPIDYTMSLGVVTKVAMENLTAQMQDLERKSQRGGLTLSPIEPEQIAAVAVVPGMGIARVFASLGVAAIVEGGQTMNPSTQEIYNAFENLPTDKIIILPNNKNIIPAAQAAAEMSTKKVAVVPSRNIPQGLAAMLRLAPEGDFGQVVDEMTQAMEEVQSGEITIATRDVEINGIKVKEGQYIALLNGQLVLSDSSLEAVCLGLLEKANAHQYELITLFYGNNISEEEANHIAELIQTAFPEQGVEVHEGGQPFYPFIISIE